MSTCVAALYAAAGGAPATTPAQDLVDTWASGGAGSDGFAMVFEDAGGTDAPSIYVKDSGTPANDTDINLTDDFSAFNAFLTYTSPSPKIVRQSDGDLKYCAHNLLTYSDTFSNAVWEKTSVTVTSDDTTGPLGSAADLLSFSGATARIVQDKTVVDNAPVELSIYLKYVDVQWVFIQYDSDITNNAFRGWFDIQNGVTGATTTNNTATVIGSSIEDAGGGWYRCRLYGTVDADANQRMDIILVTANSSTTRQAGDVHAFGAQLNYFPADTTYLPTTSAARYALPIQHDSSNNAEGLLVEPESTNLVTYSEWFSTGWTYADSTRDDNGGAGYADPSGGTRAVKQIGNNTTTTSRQESTAISLSSSTVYTASVFAKKVDTGFKDVAIIFSGRLAEAFDLDAETSSNFALIGWSKVASGVEDIDGSWKRCWVTFNTEGITASLPFRLDVENTGDGTSGILFWGGQVEPGSVPTSPIITTGTALTRAVDDLNKALTAIEHSATAGTLYAKYVPRGVATSRDIVRLDDGTANEVISIGQTSGAAARLTVTDGGTPQTDPLTSGTVVASADNKVAASWAANDFALSEGGAAASTDTSGTLPTVTTFDVGAVNGLVKEVLHLPETMSDGDLASITT